MVTFAGACAAAGKGASAAQASAASAQPVERKAKENFVI
jgi:hypothetical protein